MVKEGDDEIGKGDEKEEKVKVVDINDDFIDVN